MKFRFCGDLDCPEEENETARFEGARFEDEIFPFGRRSLLQERNFLQEDFLRLPNVISDQEEF